MDVHPHFACKCLNVRLFSRAHPVGHPKEKSDPDFDPLYVGLDGILVVHNQLTLRTRSAIFVDPHAPVVRHSQRTLLSCLLCRVAVYRIWQQVTPDTEAKEGPILPTDEWAECDTLKSSTGWVEVNKGAAGCITGAELTQALASASPIYAIVLPSTASSDTVTPTEACSPPKAFTARTHLPQLPPLIPPPPFTPSHPVFLHISKTAIAASNTLRANAEKSIAEYASQQVEHLLEAERDLKRQVEALWRGFRQGLEYAESEHQAQVGRNGMRRRVSPGRSDPSSRAAYGSPVVREFVPAPARARPVAPPSPRATSALSASLSTSAFHHPNARWDSEKEHLSNAQQTANFLLEAQAGSASNLSVSSRTESTSDSDSSLSTASSRTTVNANIPGVFRRNMDETNDAAVTFRVRTLESEAAAALRSRAVAAAQRQQADQPAALVAKKAEETRGVTESSPQAKPSGASEVAVVDNVSTTSKEGKAEGKGKRKVTFDINPDVVTIKREVDSEKAEAFRNTSQNTDDMIFDLEDVEDDSPQGEFDSEGVNGVEDDPRKLILPLNEREEPQLSPRRIKDINATGLPQSFSALRPASLPTPSHIRPPNHDRIPFKQRPAASSAKDKTVKPRSKSPAPNEDSLQPHETEFLRLVAAQTPSHRGLWAKDGDAWKMFKRRQKKGSRSGVDSPAIEEESEDPGNDDNLPLNIYASSENTSEENSNSDHESAIDIRWTNFKPDNIASSLPMSIEPLYRHQPIDGAPSLQVKTSLVDRRGVVVPRMPNISEATEKSSVAQRKAAYAQRDRSRLMDPGALDFMEDPQDDDDSTPDSPTLDDNADAVSVSRGRQHALKILKARSKLPEEGMWRSLAT